VNDQERQPTLQHTVDMLAAPKDLTEESRQRRSEQFAQAILLIALYAAPALICLHTACVNDPDLGWHLRTGQWIQQQHSVPRVDPFSSDAAGKPWAAYSWLFEWIIYQLTNRLGLIGVLTYTAGMVIAITASLHHLIKRLQRDFTLGILITLAACLSIGHLYTPRPWLFTILLFILELDILMNARRTGRLRELAWLPVIFALWANLHIQFIDGLLVLALAVAESVLAHRWTTATTKLRPMPLCAAALASLLATLANPYGWHIYRVAFDLATQSGVMDKIGELQALPFRDFVDYTTLVLALAATAALARRRRTLPFEVALLALAALLTFRSQRDVWLMAVSASAILASTLSGSEKARDRLPASAAPLSALLAGLVVAIGFPVMHLSNARLQTQLAESMPVHAVDFVLAKGYSGPLYNNFNWGGYLIWSLRLPVTIDGRTALHGDERINRSIATWDAHPDWATDPQLTAAALVIGPVQAPLTQLLRINPQFDLVFEDKVAAVFARRKSQTTLTTPLSDCEPPRHTSSPAAALQTIKTTPRN
jgi:hypothetical protein